RGAISADAVQAMAMVIARNGDLINGGGVVLYGGHHGGVWQHALQPGDRHEARVRAIADGGRCEPRLRLALFADGTYVGDDDALTHVLERRKASAGEARGLLALVDGMSVADARSGAWRAHQQAMLRGTVGPSVWRKLQEARLAPDDARATDILRELRRMLTDYAALDSVAVAPVRRQ